MGDDEFMGSTEKHEGLQMDQFLNKIIDILSAIFTQFFNIMIWNSYGMNDIFLFVLYYDKKDNKLILETHLGLLHLKMEREIIFSRPPLPYKIGILDIPSYNKIPFSSKYITPWTTHILSKSLCARIVFTVLLVIES